jgi:hypothetical protein
MWGLIAGQVGYLCVAVLIRAVSLRHDGTVQKTDLVGGVVYAVRQARQAGGDTSFSKVSYIGPCRGRQARIRHETGDLDGLVEWLPTRLIVCRWTERKAFQKEEERAAKLSASDAEVWDPVYEEAIFDECEW